MRVMVEKLLSQYGLEIRVGEETVRGLFQPVTGRMERRALPDPGPVGLQSRQRYLYIGPVEPLVQQDTELAVAGKRYAVRSAHRIEGNNGPAYSWAMCVEKGHRTDEL